ncbi:MAG: hypothetical protein U0X75_14530, partial [Acidobacteriota bacterium]
MPGIITHFQILDQFLEQADSQNPAIAYIKKVITKETNKISNKPYAYLGVMGPALADFITKDKGNDSAYAEIWKKTLQFFLADDGIITLLNKMDEFINDVVSKIKGQDFESLKSYSQKNEEFLKHANLLDLKTNNSYELSDEIFTLSELRAYIAGRISEGKPDLAKIDPDKPLQSAVPPNTWAIRNLLCWKRSGQFVKALIKNAEEEKDGRLMAYAYGYLIGYVSQVVGAPFINSIVGGPYRAQWWRHRWINNHIDAWVYGCYKTGEPKSFNDPPPEAYQGWESLCGSQSHRKIAPSGFGKKTVEFAADNLLKKLLSNNEEEPLYMVAEIFTDYWCDTFKEVYGDLYEFTDSDAPGPDIPFTPASVNQACVMAWLMLRFQTGGYDCLPKVENLMEEGACPVPDGSKEPTGTNYKDGYKPLDLPKGKGGGGSGDDGGGGFSLLDLLKLLFPGWVPGVLEYTYDKIKEFIESLKEDPFTVSPDYDKLFCGIDEYRRNMFLARLIIHKALTENGYVFPYAIELTPGYAESFPGNLGGLVTPNLDDSNQDSAIKTARSRRIIASDKKYPCQIWKPNGDDFIQSPPKWVNRPDEAQLEYPTTTAFYVKDVPSSYPSYFIDDDRSDFMFLSEGVKKPSSDPPNPQTDDQGIARWFGNAVSNAEDLFKQFTPTPDGKSFTLLTAPPDWNLDADRSVGQPTWKFLNDKPKIGSAEDPI